MNNKKHESIECDNLFYFYCGMVIRRIRKSKGMTGSQLGRVLNVSQQQMSRYERGTNKLTIDVLFNISIALNISIENLIKSVIAEIYRCNSHSDDVKTLIQRITASETIYFY